MSLHLDWFIVLLWGCFACVARPCLYSAVRFGALRTQQTMIDGFRVYPCSSEAFSIPFVWQQQSPVSSLSHSYLPSPPLQHQTLLSSRLSSSVFMPRLMSASREEGDRKMMPCLSVYRSELLSLIQFALQWHRFALLSEFWSSSLFSLDAACIPGTFKSKFGSASCVLCPANSRTSARGSSICPCQNGFYRADSDPPESACTSKSSYSSLTVRIY